MDKVPVFNNIHSFPDFVDWDNKGIQILDCMVDIADTQIEAKSLPMFKIKRLDTGEVRFSYIDEIAEEFWPSEMQAAVQGMDDWRKHQAKTENPYSGTLAKYFDHGQSLAEFKAKS